MKKVTLIIAISVIFSMIVGACGDRQKSTEQPALPSLGATEITSRADSALASANSLHFELEHNKGFTYTALDIQMEELTADVLRPDRMRGFISGVYSGAYFKDMELIIVGDTGYIKIFRWFPFDTNVNPLSFLDTVGAILNNITDVENLAAQDKDGVLCYHLKGKVNAEHLRAFVGGDVTQNIVSIELWIGGEDFLVRQVNIGGKLTNKEGSDITRIIKLSDFGEPLIIEPPEID